MKNEIFDIPTAWRCRLCILAALLRPNSLRVA